MGRIKDLLVNFNEVGQQFRTRIKGVQSSQGSRHIRNQIEDAVKKVNNMLNSNNGFPSPKLDVDSALLGDAISGMTKAIDALKSVRDSKKGIKK